MTPRESDPNGANSGGGEAGYDDRARRTNANAGSGVDATEREVITSGTAATSEVADRDAQDDAEGQGDGTLRHR
jgi:hypothetical protein